MKLLRVLAVSLGLLGCKGAAQAALIDRGGGLVYDTTRNITWLADMNYAFTSGYAATNAGGSGSSQILSDGRMGWDAARAWANSLVYGGYADWRLPTLNGSDTSCSFSFDPGGGKPVQYFGYNCTGGELSGLFVVDFGYNNNGAGLITGDDTAEQIANQALFSNLQQTLPYWSGTEYPELIRPNRALLFLPQTGLQNDAVRDRTFFALAVRSGDVVGSVPEPHLMALVLLALAGAFLVCRRGRVEVLGGLPRDPFLCSPSAVR